MKFSEAKEKLKRIADGKYHSLAYELTETRAGKLETACRLYLDQGEGKEGLLITGDTFQTCFGKLTKAIKGISYVEEIPDVEG